MAWGNVKSNPSKYKYVQNMIRDGKSCWHARYPGYTTKSYETEREAAIAIDKILISIGKEPVNILIRQ